MNIIIDDKRIEKYALFEAKEHKTKNSIFIMFEEEQYLILEIYEVGSGKYISLIETEETEIKNLDTNVWAIKKIDKDVKLKFYFKDGYLLEIKCDQEKNSLNEKRYYKAGDLVSRMIHDNFKDQIITSIEVLNALDNKEVEFEYSLRDFMYHLPNIDRILDFKMPNHPVLVKIHYGKNEKMGIVTFDTSNIKSISYENTKNANPYIVNSVTNAQYSDDYDFGLVDTPINNFSDFYYRFGQIRVKVYLIKEVNLALLVNNKPGTYKLEIKKSEVSYGGPSTTVYEYDFKFIQFSENAKISFEIIK